MKATTKATLRACFAAYIVQAVTNNFVPLLFLTFQKSFGIPLTKITLLVTFNFSLQLLVDFVSPRFIDRIGYKAAAVLAHALSAGGLVALAVLPFWMEPFSGLCLAVLVYAAGGGLLEVLVSPMVEACPTDNKEKAMSLLHSFYCWGQVGVVLLSTVFFSVFGIRRWPVMAVLWALLPLVNGLNFLRVPVPSLLPEGERGMSYASLFKTPVFWLFLLFMLCAGACEQSVNQWASTLAERSLGVSKTVGDLTGPMVFALMMGTSRLLYGRFGERLSLPRVMAGSGALCVLSYLLIAFAPVPAAGLAGCGLTGFAVGLLWPGTFSLAAATLRRGGTAMFALLALAGDLGCSSGPTLVGSIAGADGAGLRGGILLALVFPVALLAGLLLFRRQSRRGVA